MVSWLAISSVEMILHHCLVEVLIFIFKILTKQELTSQIKEQKQSYLYLSWVLRQRRGRDMEQEEGVFLVMQYKLLQTCSVRLHLSGSGVGFVFVHQGDRFTPSSLGWAMFRLD